MPVLCIHKIIRMELFQKTIHLIIINESFREYGLKVADLLRKENINIQRLEKQ